MPNISFLGALLILLRHYWYLGVWCSEMCWTAFASAPMIKRQLRLRSNWDVLLKKIKNNERVIIASGHFANWEMLLLRVCMFAPKINIYFTYRPLHNRLSEIIFKWIRTRFLGESMPEKTVLRRLSALRKRNVSGVLLTLVDHNPMRLQHKYWVPFLACQIPLTGGIYQLSRMFDASIYIPVMRRKHLFAPYTVDFEPLRKPPITFKDKRSLLQDYTKALADMVQMRPDMWMWTISRHKYAPRRGDIPLQ